MDSKDIEKFEDFEEKKTPVKRNGYNYRRRMELKHRKKRLKALNYGYKPSLGCDKGGYWVPASNSRAQQWLKRQSNKKTRKMLVPNHGGYKKAFDYYWEWF